MSRQPTCGEGAARAERARLYLEVAELAAAEDGPVAWRRVASGNAVLAGIAAAAHVDLRRLTYHG